VLKTLVIVNGVVVRGKFIPADDISDLMYGSETYLLTFSEKYPT
jgi:hypothetical protein